MREALRRVLEQRSSSAAASALSPGGEPHARGSSKERYDGMMTASETDAVPSSKRPRSLRALASRTRTRNGRVVGFVLAGGLAVVATAGWPFRRPSGHFVRAEASLPLGTTPSQGPVAPASNSALLAPASILGARMREAAADELRVRASADQPAQARPKARVQQPPRASVRATTQIEVEDEADDVRRELADDVLDLQK